MLVLENGHGSNVLSFLHHVLLATSSNDLIPLLVSNVHLEHFPLAVSLLLFEIHIQILFI